MKPALKAAGTILSVTLLAACSDAGEEAETIDRQAPPTAEAATAQQQMSTPDTTAESVWAFLESEAYRENLHMWPGKDRLYPGTEPHGMLLTTYANSTAYQALLDGEASDLPAGSIIVKENWMPDSTFEAATVMYKVDGYNPDHQDWLFGKFDPRGSPEAFGRAADCQACHQAAETGYLYTAVEQ